MAYRSCKIPILWSPVEAAQTVATSSDPCQGFPQSYTKCDHPTKLKSRGDPFYLLTRQPALVTDFWSCVMSLVKLLAISCLLAYGWAKPLKSSFAPRQVEPPTASLEAISTACGDIIVAVNNGKSLLT